MQLTKNFHLNEFACKDGTPVPPEFYGNVTHLAKQLQVIRDELGVAVTVTGSGYRTPSHNAKVGGAKNSQHLTASGADINAAGHTPRQLYTKIERLIREGKIVEGGLGLYKVFVHYDVRGVRARW